MWKQTGRQYREAVNSCHTLVLWWQRGAEWGKEWNCKWRARQTVEQVLRWSTSRPEENVGLLTDRVSPGKLRNWSGTHSSPAATIKGTQSVKSKRLTIVYLLKNRVWASYLFRITIIFLAQGFEKLQIHLWLWRSGFSFALAAASCPCRRALNFADCQFWTTAAICQLSWHVQWKFYDRNKQWCCNLL